MSVHTRIRLLALRLFTFISLSLYFSLSLFSLSLFLSLLLVTFLCGSINVSFFLFAYLSIRRSVCLSLSLSPFLSVYPCASLCLCLSICLSLSISLSYQFLNLDLNRLVFTYLPFLFSLRLTLCLFASIHHYLGLFFQSLPVYTLACLCIDPSSYQSIYLTIYPPNYLPICKPIYLSTYLSIH